MANLQDIDKAVEEIKQGKARLLYLVYGDQDYLVKQAYDRICEALIPAEVRDFNLEQHDGATAEVSEVVDALATMPMMSGAKVVGVPDCRYFLSKSNGADLLLKSKSAWESKDTNASLRHLAKVLVLAGSNWQDAVLWQLKDFKSELGIDKLEEGKHGGEWMNKALAQGLASNFTMPKSGDDSGKMLESLKNFLEPASGQTPRGQHLVIAAPSADGRKLLYKYFASQGLVLDFKSVTKGYQAGQTAKVFLKNHLRQRDLDLDIHTAERVIAAYGHDLGLMVKEIDKMEAHAHPRRRLHTQDLEAVGSPRPEESIFKLIDALGEKRLDKVLPLLREQLAVETPMQLFGRLAAETRMLFISRAILDEGLAPAKGPSHMSQYKAALLPQLIKNLPPALAEMWKKKHAFVTYQSLRRAGHFEPAHLRGMLRHLHEAEARLTSSGGDRDAILEEICVRFCGVEEEVFL